MKNTRKPYELRAALGSKGFEPEERDHTFYFLRVCGRKVGIWTKVHHHRGEYGVPLLGKMARKMHLNRRELDDFIECPLTREGYLDLMRERHAL